VEHCGSIGSGTIVAEVNEGECSLGFGVEFEVFKMDIVNERQVHGREGRDGYHFWGGIQGVYIAFGAQSSHGCGICHIKFSD
jgi:hypothetical protein